MSALKTMASQGGPKYTLSQQPWAQPGIRILLSWNSPFRKLLLCMCSPCCDIWDVVSCLLWVTRCQLRADRSYLASITCIWQTFISRREGGLEIYSTKNRAWLTWKFFVAADFCVTPAPWRWALVGTLCRTEWMMEGTHLFSAHEEMLGHYFLPDFSPSYFLFWQF